MKFIVSSKIALATAVLFGGALTNVNADSVKDLSIMDIKLSSPVGEAEDGVSVPLCKKITVSIWNKGKQISDRTHRLIHLTLINNKNKHQMGMSTSIIDPTGKLKRPKGRILYEYDLGIKSQMSLKTYGNFSVVLTGPDGPGTPSNTKVIKSVKLYCGKSAEIIPYSKSKR